jgi:hypothetical protein
MTSKIYTYLSSIFTFYQAGEVNGQIGGSLNAPYHDHSHRQLPSRHGGRVIVVALLFPNRKVIVQRGRLPLMDSVKVRHVFADFIKTYPAFHPKISYIDACCIT